MTRQRLSFVALLLVTLVAGLTAQSQTPKRMMGGQLVLEDQGSFFVGGVTKITDYAAIPGAPPGQQAPPPTPQQITIGQMYVQFQIPAKRSAPGWPVIMVHGSTHTGARARVDARRPRGLVSVLRPQGRLDLRRRSVGPRPLGIRSVGAARGRGADGSPATRRAPRS